MDCKNICFTRIVMLYVFLVKQTKQNKSPVNLKPFFGSTNTRGFNWSYFILDGAFGQAYSWITVSFLI